MNKINARGLSCPGPVLQAKTVIEKDHPQAVEIAVDNAAAKQNVVRFLESQAYKASVKEEGGVFYILGKENGPLEAKASEMEKQDADVKKIMVMISSDRMGRGDDGLGKKLMVNFVKTLNEMGSELWRLVFVNSGVKLTIECSGALEDLKILEEQKVHMLVCGTCLDHFNLLDKKQVGETTNMLDIVTAMQLSDKVINI